jgi:hypothetical protein
MVCLSTAEAEYIAATEAAKESIWLLQLICEILRSEPVTVPLFEDNQACIHMSENPVVSARNRHFARRMWWLRNQVTAGLIKLQFVPTKLQLADIFTKTLPTPRFTVLATSLLLSLKRVFTV